MDRDRNGIVSFQVREFLFISETNRLTFEGIHCNETSFKRLNRITIDISVIRILHLLKTRSISVFDNAS